MPITRSAALAMAAASIGALVYLYSPRARAVLTAAPSGLEKIQHFVFIMRENRSFDSYFGPQSQYPGLDQVNVQIPADLRGRGRLSVVVTVNGQISNPVWITLA